MERQWAEVVRLAKARRSKLVRSQQQVADTANARLGPKSLSEPTVRVFERGEQTSFRPSTLAAISVGLDWPPDALIRLRDGEDPAALDPAEGEAPPWEELLEGQRRITEALERLADRIEGQ